MERDKEELRRDLESSKQAIKQQLEELNQLRGKVHLTEVVDGFPVNLCHELYF